MKQNLMGIVVVLVSVCYASIVFATDAKPMNARAEKKTTLPGAKMNKDVLRDAKKIEAEDGSTSTGGGDSGKDQDPAKSSASRSKKDHETAEKVIDNLK